VVRTRDDGSTSDRTTRFFAELQARGHEPLLVHASGTLRFDLVHGTDVEQWFITLAKGELQVSRDDRDADVIFDVDGVLFEGMTEGTVNALAAVLRGDLRLVGDLALAMAFQRVFPGPPGAQGPNTPETPSRLRP
jgi:putative sterol carrier protein